MRSLVMAVLLCGTVGFVGCGQSPADTPSAQRMLTPEELEQVDQEFASVQQEEKAQNARTPPRKPSR